MLSEAGKLSDLEYEHWLQVETDPDIIDFCDQPIKMEMIENEKTYSSIVDMWVKYKSNEEAYIEIKYRKDLLKETVKKQIYIQEEFGGSKNYFLKIVRQILFNRTIPC
ncbi:TnsA endonuclease N-terminal domain-containing protein [Lysinibacillus sp. M3]|uniref:TnsA endonuclease N-terminal domain-containing protein n=1 Tax=Lysinibacillus zambalensis TaxID=3160866 RepID=A0ABV1MKZ5_9BACI